jgi:c-di-GMP-binding flagellar brake protein YcgR
MSVLVDRTRELSSEKDLERRRWERIPLAIPVFIRGKDADGKEFREFTTAFNISAGGILLATRRYVPKSSSISLEIPAGPMSSQLAGRKFYRDLVGRAVTVTHSEQCYLCGVKFSRPLVQRAAGRKSKKKNTSIV